MLLSLFLFVGAFQAGHDPHPDLPVALHTYAGAKVRVLAATPYGPIAESIGVTSLYPPKG